MMNRQLFLMTRPLLDNPFKEIFYTMDRRDFCKAISGTALAIVTPEAWSMSAEDGKAQIEADDYARFCAQPELDREFSVVAGDQIVKTKLDVEKWQKNTYDAPAKLPGISDSWDGVPMQSPVAGLSGKGPYKPDWESLLQYEAPEWYQDAKFGIWAHWSPQCVPEKGDWYARNMYEEGSEQYKYHLEHYGHPSQFGYKDLCPQWTLLNWEPEELIDRYKKAGARFFFALANHHDGFDCWNSKHHPWNTVNIGPHQDVIGTWARAARQGGLKLGVTVHQARNWWWFEPSHGSDSQGPKAGALYDGKLRVGSGADAWWKDFDPQRLYGVKHPADALPDLSYVKNFYDRTRDLIDQHDPDLLYFDNSMLPLGWAGMNIAAYYYNRSVQAHNGRVEVALNIKNVPDRLVKGVVADFERGVTDAIMPYAWQSETCIGGWHYDRSLYEKPGEFGGYLHPRDAVHWLIDTVSKNGTFVLNIPGKPDGTIDSKEIAVLDKIAAWMNVNGEAIYETRPWKVFGEGPHSMKSGAFQGTSVAALGADDIRFTRNKANTTIYAIALGWPSEVMTIKALGANAATSPGKIGRVQLIGTDAPVVWKQTSEGLRVELPKQYRPAVDYGAALRITLA
jgi:alpha-L-fucosidase